MKKQTARGLVLWIVFTAITMAASWVKLIRDEPGWALPEKFTEDPASFIAGYAILVLLAIGIIGFFRASFQVQKELKEERERLEEKLKRKK